MFFSRVVRTISVSAATLLMSVTLWAAPIKVVIGSALIGDIVQDLLGAEVEMLQVTAGSLCPGHNDMKPTDLLFAAKADVAVLHGFQKKMPSTAVLKEFETQGKVKVLWVNTHRAWTIPQVQIEAGREVARVLKETLSKDRTRDIDARLTLRESRVRAAETEARARLQPLHGVPVVVAKRQSEFCEWAGLTLVAEFTGGDTMTPKVMTEAVVNAKKTKAVGVIENLQNKSNVSTSIAREISVPVVILSNFPGAPESAKTYFDLLNHNVDMLLKLRK